MTRFIDFLATNRDGTPGLLSSKQSESALTVAISNQLCAIKSENKPLLSALEARTTASQISSVAYDERFLREFSEVIGMPKPGETEDQFVARCKEQMASMLLLKFEN